PTISAEDVALANPPGFSRPEMATLKRLDIQAALLPLLGGRLAIRRVVLVQPVIALEIDRAGESNLSFVAPPAAARGTGAPPAASGPSRPVAVDVRAIRITDGTLSWQDDRTGRHGTLSLGSFTATAASDTAPVVLAADARYAGLPFTLRGQTGPLSRLAARGAGPPWPLRLAFAVGQATLSLDGSVADPAAGRGYRFGLQATLPALEALAPLLPGRKLPALHDVTLAADLADSGSGRPAISDLSLDVGASDLGTLEPGLTLTGLSFTAPALDQPCKLTLAGAVGKAPFSLDATLGPPAALLPAGFGPPPPATPWPVAIHAAAAGADLAISGTMTEPARLAGASLAVSLQVPDVAALAPLAGRPLPSLSQIVLSGQIADAETGWRQWVKISDFSLTVPQGDLSGEATLALAGARPSVSAALTSSKLDLDALKEAFATPGPAPGATPVAPPAPPPVPPPGVAEGPPGLIPATPIPFALLDAADADLTLGIQSLTVGRATYGNVAGKLALKDGHLTLDPFSFQGPGGHVALTASASAPAANAPPQVGMTLNAPALALSPLLAAFGLPAEASGTIQVQARLSGAGTSPQAIAAGLNGAMGVAMAGGSVDNRVVTALLGSVLSAARVPPELLGSGQSQVRCFAGRLDFAGGTGTLGTLLLEASRLTLTGGGSLALGPETLALRLDPSYQYGANAISLPVRVGGTFLAPKVGPDVAGAVATAAKPEGALAQLLGALRGAPAAAVPACEPALALARFGQPGPAPPPAAPAPSAPSGKSGTPNSPLNLLRGLLHQ
ncbi:MAG TPA: AsmA family protein, partial [Acetobacteraceae bacterium]|nr:AsmA family protein [Acetobacteraceae bacterium]